jgi:hypothetical protein
MAWLMDYTLTSERKGIEFEHTRYPSSLSSAQCILYLFYLYSYDPSRSHTPQPTRATTSRLPT